MRLRQRGFTVIEVMFVIAIIAILLMLAVPMYLDYTARSRVTECLGMQAPAKLKVSEAVIDDHVMPQVEDVPVNRTTDFCDAGLYTRDSDDAATLYIRANEDALGVEGETVEGRLEARRCDNNDVEWSCYYASSGGDTTQGRYLPVSCRTTVVTFSDSCFASP